MEEAIGSKADRDRIQELTGMMSAVIEQIWQWSTYKNLEKGRSQLCESGKCIQKDC